MKTTIQTTPAASLLLFSLIAALPACVTVNVTFPEAAVQQATDDYVQGLYKEKEKAHAQPSAELPVATPSKKPSAALGANGAFKVSISAPLAFREASAAEAGEMKISVNSSKAMTIRDRQVARLDQIHGAKAAGSLGETSAGFLTLDHGGKVAPAVRSKLQPLVDAENKDRKELYEEILSSNGYPVGRLVDLGKSFARSFQSHSTTGTWIQDETGKWSQKP